MAEYTLPLLPEPLEPYRAMIEATVRPYIKIDYTISEETTPFDSKIGGDPYFPLDDEYPTDEAGRPLALLAQINFEEVPHLEHYPESGILQFYISLYFTENDGGYGFDHDAPHSQANWRILWFPVVERDETKLINDFSFVPTNLNYPDGYGLPFVNGEVFISRETPARLSFNLGYAPATTGDYHFEILLSGAEPETDIFEQFGDQRFDIQDLYGELFRGQVHKIGGYATFAQIDPRTYDQNGNKVSQINPENPSLLLLQIESDPHIMWGDAGVANFFIDQQDLINRDFSRVLYNVDGA